MSPHEEAAHIASAWRQIGPAQRLALVRRIKGVAAWHLARFATQYDFENYDSCVALALTLKLGTKKASPSERGAAALLRACVHALETDDTTERVKDTILHAYSSLEDTERALGASRRKAHARFAENYARRSKAAADKEHEKWRLEAAMIRREIRHAGKSALAIARIVKNRLAIDATPSWISRFVKKPSARK